MRFCKAAALALIWALGAPLALAQTNYLGDDDTWKPVLNSDLPAMAAKTTKCNPGAASATPSDCTATQVEAVLGIAQNFVADYAGVNDGVTNNFTQFQAACTGLTSGKLFIPAGEYAITVPASTVLCAPAANTVFEGAGKGVTTLTLTATTDSAYTNIFNLINANVAFRNLSITLVTSSTTKTTLFGLQANSIRIENCALTGDVVEGVRVGGSATNGDAAQIIFTSSSLAGSPITIAYTVLTGNTPEQIAQGLVTAVNANATITAAGIVASRDGAFVKISQPDTMVPQASYTTNVTGSATETLTVGPSAELSVVVISGTEADDFSMLYDDVTGFNYVILKANATATINRRFSFVGGYYTKNITGAFNINSPSGTFEGVLIDGVHIGSVGLNDANNLPIALSYVAYARVVNNHLKGTYQANAMHFEERSNQLVVANNVVAMTTTSALGDGYEGSCMYFVDNNVGGAGYKAVNDVNIHGNTCIALTTNESGYAIWQASVSAASLRWSIAGNVFSGFSSGIRLDVMNGVSVTGNAITNYAASGTGINLGAGVTYANVNGNTIRTYSTLLTTAATLSQIFGNIGYNPVGVTASANVGASPATNCAGSSPETHYYVQSATNTATVALSGNTVGVTTSATLPVVVHLGPNECTVTTWATTQPTVTKSVH